jgi:hypothetical protein
MDYDRLHYHRLNYDRRVGRLPAVELECGVRTRARSNWENDSPAAFQPFPELWRLRVWTDAMRIFFGRLKNRRGISAMIHPC